MTVFGDAGLQSKFMSCPTNSQSVLLAVQDCKKAHISPAYTRTSQRFGRFNSQHKGERDMPSDAILVLIVNGFFLVYFSLNSSRT